MVNFQAKIDQLLALHADKEKVYQGSWCKRGELLSILPNILRKVDRLDAYVQQVRANDQKSLEISLSLESLEDTICDLLVYLCKYDSYLDVGKDDFQLSQLKLARVLLNGLESFHFMDTQDEFLDYLGIVINSLNELAYERTEGNLKGDEDIVRKTLATLYPFLTDLILTLWRNDKDGR